MASSPMRSKTHLHVRSISWPSASHPLTPLFNEHFCRVRVYDATSSVSISNRLSNLEDLYECVDDLLLLPRTQQVFGQERREKWVDEVLDGYLMLLDTCATTKEVISETKQNVQELLLILRRNRVTNDFGKYITSRKKAKKLIQKSLRSLKSINNKRSFLALDKDHESMAIVNIMNEVKLVALDMFESLLLYISGTKVQSRASGWSLFTKLMHHKSGTCQDEETETNEFAKVDAVLHSFVDHKTNKFDTRNFQTQLRKLESSIEDLEGRLECLFRRLIKTRVSLLNILNY